MSVINLGIIGGGQLGSMLAVAAKKLDIKTIIFCDDINAPAQNFCDEFICGKYDDKNKILDFVSKTTIITFEFENIPYQTLNEINKHKPVLPKPSVNRLIQHRLAEKDFINKLNIRTTRYVSIEKKSEIENLCAEISENPKSSNDVWFRYLGTLSCNERSKLPGYSKNSKNVRFVEVKDNLVHVFEILDSLIHLVPSRLYMPFLIKLLDRIIPSSVKKCSTDMIFNEFKFELILFILILSQAGNVSSVQIIASQSILHSEGPTLSSNFMI